MKNIRFKIQNFYFKLCKHKTKLCFLFFALLIAHNLVKNFSLCNFRNRADTTQIFSFFRDEITPATKLRLHMYEEAADGLFNYLDYIRRDISNIRHNNALNSELLTQNTDLFLSAFLDLKNRSKEHSMFYVSDKDIGENFYLLPVHSRFPMRFIMGDIFNLQLYQGFEARQLYYALPKGLEGMKNPIRVEISASNFEKYKILFLNNWEVLDDRSFIRPKYIGLVSNIAVFKPTDPNIREVTVKISVALNPTNNLQCIIKKVDLSFYLNNIVVKSQTLKSGENKEIILKIPVSALSRQLNFLAIVPFYNSVNCFYPSQLYPAAQGALAKGEYPYLIKSLYITEK